MSISICYDRWWNLFDVIIIQILFTGHGSFRDCTDEWTIRVQDGSGGRNNLWKPDEIKNSYIFNELMNELLFWYLFCLFEMR